MIGLYFLEICILCKNLNKGTNIFISPKEIQNFERSNKIHFEYFQIVTR